MSLFISDLGFSDGELVDAAKLGILVRTPSPRTRVNTRADARCAEG